MKNKTSVLFMCVFIFSLFSSQAQPSSDFITVMKKEAKELKKNKVLFRAYLAKEDSLYIIYNNLKKTKMHYVHPPNLKTLDAPLAYFYIRFKAKVNVDRFADYTYAIAKNKFKKDQAELLLGHPLRQHYTTQNRLGFLSFIKDNHKNLIQDWDALFISSADANWANGYIISVSLKVTHEKRKYALDNYDDKRDMYSDIVIKHWADSLNLKNKTKAYNYLDKLYANGISYYHDADFKLLFKLKPIETQNKLLKYLYYDNGSPNSSAIVLFAHFNTENIQVANELMKFRKKMDVDGQKYLNTAIYFMNPKQGKREVIAFLKKEIQGKEAMENNYFNARKVLKHFSTDLCKFSDNITILLEYLKSDNLSIFGDITRVGVLEAIIKTSSKHNKEILTALRKSKTQTAKNILNDAVKMIDLMGKKQ